MALRPAGATDLDRLVEIERASHPTPWSSDALRSFLHRSSVRFLVSVEGDGENVTGFGIVRWTGGEGEVLNLAVSPSHRRRGIAGGILDALLDFVREREVRAVFLEVRESNLPARALYRGRGFREVGVRRQYYTNPTEDARILRIELAGPGRDPGASRWPALRERRS
jgi:[ribosomal protein S18]-alanine N-acetyltransferase